MGWGRGMGAARTGYVDGALEEVVERAEADHGRYAGDDAWLGGQYLRAVDGGEDAPEPKIRAQANFLPARMLSLYRRGMGRRRMMRSVTKRRTAW